MVQLHIADDIPQGGGGQAFNGQDGTLHAVGIQLGVGHLVKDDGIDLHGDIILGDNRLRRKVHHLLLQRDPLGDPVHQRHLEVQAGFPGGVIGPQPLDNELGSLRYHADVGDKQNNKQNS